MKWMLGDIGVGNKCLEHSIQRMLFGNTKLRHVDAPFSTQQEATYETNRRVPFEHVIFALVVQRAGFEPANS